MNLFLQRLFLGVLVLLLCQSQVAESPKSDNFQERDKTYTEAKAVAAQVFVTDLIVQGSACVGVDCASSESFGFDTQRYKENNLRIHFNDTSSSASFPSNDWRIIINDSSNGGANYFGIEDSSAGRIPFRIEGGAPANSLYVDDAGRIGVGTSTPVVEMHVQDGDTPTMRLQQDGSSGFQAQTWDVAGNETNFFIRDATNGSLLPFKIEPGTGDNTLFLENDEDIGFGTNNPLSNLHIRKSVRPTIRLERSSTPAGAWEISGDGDDFAITKKAASDSVMFKVMANSTPNSIVVGPDGVYVKNALLPGASAPSDIRLKSKLVSISDATKVIAMLVPKTFYFKEDLVSKYNLPSSKQYGFVAQEVEPILPDLVRTSNLFGDGTEYKVMSYEGLIPLLVKGFQEQQELINSQAIEIYKMQEQIKAYAKLEARLEALENRTSTQVKTKR